MAELALNDLILGQTLLSIEGRVVEYFTENHGSVGRVHLGQLHCVTTGPNDNGYYQVSVSPSASGQGGFTITVEGASWIALAPMIAELESAARAPNA